MKCNEVEPLLIDFLDGRIDTISREEIAKHLETCEKCAGEARELKELILTMAGSTLEEPTATLRENFNSMLQSEQNILETANILKTTNILKGSSEKRAVRLLWTSPFLRMAAAFLLLVMGILIGSRIKSGAGTTPSSGEISALQKEVRDMKEVLMFSLIKGESPSDRIKAVSYVEEMSNPDQKVIGALINTLNHDKTVNVRLASLYSLARFSDNQAVRDSLVESLSRQTEPIIQVVLINILTERKDPRAIKPIRDIISNEKTLKEVKEVAEKGLKTL